MFDFHFICGFVRASLVLEKSFLQSAHRCLFGVDLSYDWRYDIFSEISCGMVLAKFPVDNGADW